MRVAYRLIALAGVVALLAGALTIPSVGRVVGFHEAHAAGNHTLYVSGIEIGRGRQALVRLRNTSTVPADVLSVKYTVRDPSIGHPLSEIGAGPGAQLRPGDTLELDLGKIVNAFRAGQEVSGWDGPVQFVAFGEGGHVGNFGPETVQVEVVQKVKRAQFALPVEWIED